MKEIKISTDSELGELDKLITNKKALLEASIDKNYSSFDSPPSKIPASASWFDYLPSSNWITNYPPTFSSVNNYLPSWSTLGYGSTALLTTLPFLPYCLTSTPAVIGKEWWSSMALENQAFLIASAGIFLMIGTATRYKYFHSTMDNLKKIFVNFCSNISDFTYSSSILLVASIAATPAAALGYYGSIWAGKVIASSAAFSNFMVTAAFRIVFIPNFLNSMSNLFNNDRRFQKQVINQLNRIKTMT